MKKSPLPYKQLIFVCTNSRDEGERISCAGKKRCGKEILDQLKDYISDKKLKRLIRASKSGCQELCEQGPVVTIMPQNVCLTEVSENDVPEIIETYLKPHRA
jgi:(2Fe-2S) ferredoxin